MDIQDCGGTKKQKRRLTEGEQTLANMVFNGKITLRKVRVHGCAHETESPHTVGNDIHFPPNANGTAFVDSFHQASLTQQAKFIHELAHVWQNQTQPRASLGYHKALNYSEHLEMSLLEYLDRLAGECRYKDHRPVMDIVSRPLHVHHETRPVTMPTTISADNMDGTTSTKPANGADVANSGILEQFIREHAVPDTRKNRERIRRFWHDSSDYNYLTFGWEKLAFSGLNREAQADMIMDYFILLCGGNPLDPTLCKGNMFVPHSGQVRPPLSVYKKIIPFVQASRRDRVTIASDRHLG
ncbi:hypothetical protein SAMN05421772_110100 [Paracoccus saliphilus]|nr:hypothetical protein SAMN05421772_110100 [Paracoccus saliphilus]